MPKVVLFDVNETLLDVHALQPELTGLLGKSVSVREWFLEVLQHTLVINETKEYRTFGEIAEAVLQMIASSQGRQLQPDEIKTVRKSQRPKLTGIQLIRWAFRPKRCCW